MNKGPLKPPGTYEDRDARWPVWLTFATAAILPKTTAVRTLHAGFGRAYLIHLSALVLVALSSPVLDEWKHLQGPTNVLLVLAQSWEQLELLGDQFALQPLQMSLSAGGIVVGIELAVFLAALIAAPWGARDEPIRSSIGSSVRRTWLHTPHVLFAILVAGVVGTSLIRTYKQWLVATTPEVPYPIRPQQPTGPPANSPAWEEYRAAQKKYQADRREYNDTWDQAWAKMPWYARHAYHLSPLLFAAAVAWVLWGWLRCIGAPRPVVPRERPPLCETCGYGLTRAPPEGRCSECGEAVAASLGPEARPGTLWQRRAGSGGWHAWWRCTIDPIVRPRTFGRTVQLTTTTTSHRGFLAVYLLLVLLTGWLGALGCFITQTGWGDPEQVLEMLWRIHPLVAFGVMVLALAVCLSVATLVAAWYQATDKRNLMPVTMQAVAYLGGALLLWTIISVAITALLFAAADWLTYFARPYWVDPVFVGFMVWLVLNLILLLVYLRLILRITAGARYANR